MAVETTEGTLREEIVTVCHRLRAGGLVVAMEGNVSCRFCRSGGEDAVLATPTMKDKATLVSDDLVKTDLEGRAAEGEPRPSSEMPLHLALYRARPDVCGVVHAHPPYATSFAVAGIPLDQPLLAEAVVDLGEVPVAPYGTPGRVELARNIAELAEKGHNVILMANHGAVALGRTVTEAFHRMETLEHYAQIALLTRILGKSSPLGPGEVEQLLEARRRRESAAPFVGCPVCRTAGTDRGSETGTGPDRYVLTREELIALIEEAVSSLGRGRVR